MSYREAKAKYGFSAFDNELANRITRMQDFDLLDAELERAGEKPTAEQVEKILDRFNYLIGGDDEYHCLKSGYMGDAIGDVMGLAYRRRMR